MLQWKERINDNQPDETTKLTKVKKYKIIYYMFLLSWNRKIRHFAKSSFRMDFLFSLVSCYHTYDSSFARWKWRVQIQLHMLIINLTRRKKLTKLKKYKIIYYMFLLSWNWKIRHLEKQHLQLNFMKYACSSFHEDIPSFTSYKWRVQLKHHILTINLTRRKNWRNWKSIKLYIICFYFLEIEKFVTLQIQATDKTDKLLVLHTNEEYNLSMKFWQSTWRDEIIDEIEKV